MGYVQTSAHPCPMYISIIFSVLQSQIPTPHQECEGNTTSVSAVDDERCRWPRTRTCRSNQNNPGHVPNKALRHKNQAPLCHTNQGNTPRAEHAGSLSLKQGTKMGGRPLLPLLSAANIPVAAAKRS